MACNVVGIAYNKLSCYIFGPPMKFVEAMLCKISPYLLHVQQVLRKAVSL